MNLTELVNALNENDFRAFPQKNNPGKLTLSAEENGNRFFISRAAIGQNEDATPKYGWTRGKQWREQT